LGTLSFLIILISACWGRILDCHQSSFLFLFFLPIPYPTSIAKALKTRRKRKEFYQIAPILKTYTIKKIEDEKIN
jgi:hypothetical protein